MKDLLVARSITHAQQMAKVLERFGIPYTLKRASAQMTKHGCGYVLAIRNTDTTQALKLLQENAVIPTRIIYREKLGNDGVLP